jgi:hypothetical protein
VLQYRENLITIKNKQLMIVHSFLILGSLNSIYDTFNNYVHELLTCTSYLNLNIYYDAKSGPLKIGTEMSDISFFYNVRIVRPLKIKKVVKYIVII